MIQVKGIDSAHAIAVKKEFYQDKETLWRR